MNNNDQHLYTLTRGQFAKSIGKSIGSVKIAMRRGGYKDDYIYVNGRYLFRPRECTRENHVNVPSTIVPPKVNRGNHSKGNYQNIKGNNGEAFKEHNKMKKLIALKKNIPEDVAERYLSKVDKLMAQEEKENNKRVREADLKLNYQNNRYGGLIRNPGYISWSTEWHQPLQKEEPKEDYEYADDPNDKTYYW